MATTPKVVNDPRCAVDEMIEGLLLTNPSLCRLPHHRVLLRRDYAEVRDTQVAIVSGGGSGHEPAHAGLVGRGMLTAAVAGDTFASPPAAAVLAALRAVTGARGCLLVVKNFAGDRIHFESAAAVARSEGLRVETVVCRDDVALASLAPEQRRGLAGTVLVHKAAGAAAEAGLPLEAVRDAALAVIEGDAGLRERHGGSREVGAASAGVALGGCSLPGQAPAFSLGVGEVELGVGIHGEKGAERSALRSADELVAWLCSCVRASNAALCLSGTKVAALVNGLGGTTNMELAIAARAALAGLRGAGLDVQAVAVGAVLTSLEMPGISLTVLPFTDPALLDRIMSPTDAPGWVPFRKPQLLSAIVAHTSAAPAKEPGQHKNAPENEAREKCLTSVMRAVIAAEPKLTQLDREVGDGDMGVCAKLAAERLLDVCGHVVHASAAETLRSLAMAVQDFFGGTAGGLTGVLLARVAERLRGKEASVAAVAEAFADGVSAVVELGGAKIGDKTMVDALVPAAEALKNTSSDDLGSAFREASSAALIGAQSTKEMAGKRGRSGYIGERARGFEDPGAVLVHIVLDKLSKELALDKLSKELAPSS